MKRLIAFAITLHDANALAGRTSHKPTNKRVRSIITSMTGSCALMMTGFGIATPVFARRLGELGAGVEVLSLMAMASALAQFLLTCGPVIGGLLCAQWGDLTPFGVAALLDLLALVVVWMRVPETREAAILHVQQQEKKQGHTRHQGLAASLPRPRSFFAVLLLLDVIAAFGMAFIEPQMIFYLYNALSWTPAQYGLMMGGYGVATLVGQVTLSQLGDHLGRKPIIALGFLFNSTLPLGLTIVRQFSLLAPLALFAGLGSACITPALGASYLDITASQHRSVIQGIRESAISFSAVAGPLLATFISRWLAPQGIFTVAAVIQLSASILALVVLKLLGTNPSLQRHCVSTAAPSAAVQGESQAKAPAFGRVARGRRADTSNPLGYAAVAMVAQIHYALHCTFITRPPYTYNRKDERQADVERSMRAHHRWGKSWSMS